MGDLHTRRSWLGLGLGLAMTIEWHGRGSVMMLKMGMNGWVSLLSLAMQAFGQCIADVYFFPCLFGVWAWVSVR